MKHGVWPARMAPCNHVSTIVGSIVITNVWTYRAIAEEAHERMREVMGAHTRPRDGGGSVLTHDPTRSSFKQAFIAVVFADVWLEATTHLAIVQRFGIEKAAQCDRERWSYVAKLRLLGGIDQDVIARAERLRRSRNELVHEKAFLDSGDIRNAQDEADNAHELLTALRDLCGGPS